MHAVRFPPNANLSFGQDHRMDCRIKYGNDGGERRSLIPPPFIPLRNGIHHPRVHQASTLGDRPRLSSGWMVRVGMWPRNVSSPMGRGCRQAGEGN